MENQIIQFRKELVSLRRRQHVTLAFLALFALLAAFGSQNPEEINAEALNIMADGRVVAHLGAVDTSYGMFESTGYGLEFLDPNGVRQMTLAAVDESVVFQGFVPPGEPQFELRAGETKFGPSSSFWLGPANVLINTDGPSLALSGDHVGDPMSILAKGNGGIYRPTGYERGRTSTYFDSQEWRNKKKDK